MIPAWCKQYIGLPFKRYGRDRSGVDCWGLYRLALGEQTGNWVPLYEQYTFSDLPPEEDKAERARVAAQIQEDLGRYWTQIPKGQEQPFDGVLMRIYGQPAHVGLVVAPGRMLHIEKGIDAAIEDYAGVHWRHRVLGFYRYGSPSAAV